MSGKTEFYEVAVKLVAAIDSCEELCTRQEAEALKAQERAADYFVGKRAVAIYLRDQAAALRALCDGERS